MVEVPLLAVGILAGLALLLVLWQLRITRRLRRELEEVKAELAQLSTPREEKRNTRESFSTRLDEVERQQLRPSAPKGNATEKYRYVASLAAQGMDARGIAEALQLAPAEVEQLLRLAKLKSSDGR